MKTQSEQVQRWDDIIFEKRNKEYGAYAIRKSYDDRVLTGSTISLGVIVMIFLSSFLSLKESDPVVNAIIGCSFPIPPPIVTPNQKVNLATSPPPKQINRNFPPVAIAKEIPEAPEPLKPVEPPTNGGTGNTGLPVEGSEQSGGINTGDPIEVPAAPPYLLAPEVMPVYEGGMEAMIKFLQKKLRYPSSAQKKREEGTVYVSFIISSTGEVTNIEIVKGFYKDCDKEAARVISMMNKWKPGLQNKMPVAVKMVLPIKFKLSS